MAFTIKKVIIEGVMPESCGHCHLSTDSDYGDVYCCATEELDRDVTNYLRGTRPDWCPLMVLAENEKLGVFRYVGKGKIIPSTEMWIDDCIEIKAESKE